MEFIKPDINFDFVGKMKIAFSISMAAIVISTLSLIIHGGPNYGIDFAGGTLVQVKFQKEANVDQIRGSLESIGMKDSLIQSFGAGADNEYLIRTAESSDDIKGLSERIEESLASVFGKNAFEVRRVEVVGPKVGKELTEKGILAMVFAWLAMLAYISWRFEFRYAVGAILALIHDVLITVGVFSVLGKEFTLVIVAALLTIIGYSINDTIVVYDRIRENVRRYTKQGLAEVINTSINQTLSRTILTSFTVFLVLVALLFFGGAVIFDFAFALLIGIVVGTYSSIFVASTTVLAWERLKPSKRSRKK